MSLLLIASLSGGFDGREAGAQCVIDDRQRVQSTSPANGDYFGQSVALDDRFAIVGSPSDDERMEDAGAAFVFVFDQDAWRFQERLFDPDEGSGDLFGLAVALSGNIAVVGAPLRSDNGASSGAAYVFRFDGAQWALDAKLLPSDGVPLAQFGSAVAVDEDTVVVGAFRDDDRGRASGGAYVFKFAEGVWGSPHPSIAGAVREGQKLVAADGDALDQFGIAVDIDRDVIVVGAYGDDDRGDYTGAGYVYRFLEGAFRPEGKLLASDRAEGLLFGFPVAVDGDTILAGSLADDDNGYASGSAYVYTFDGESWGVRDEEASNVFTERAKLLPIDGENAAQFGRSVALDGDIALVGANLANESGVDSGVAYVFVRSPGGWSETQKLRPRDGDTNWHFGEAAALDGGVAVVGSVGDSNAGRNAGSAYFFNLSEVGDVGRDCNGNRVADDCEPDCNANGTPDDCDLRDRRSKDCNGDGRPDDCSTGVVGLYYPNLELGGRPLLRLDRTIDFVWPNGIADARLATNRFSVRWITRIVPPARDVYTFHAFMDDGVRLWVNRRLLIDHWEEQGPTERSGSIVLSAGTRYELILEYFNNGGPGTALLRWSTSSMPKQTIPVERLANPFEDDCNGNGVLDGCDAGDMDGAGALDLNDFAEFQNCFSGGLPVDLDTCCALFDGDFDGRLTRLDLAVQFPAIGIPRD